MIKKVFIVSFVVAVISMVGLVVCYILANNQVNLWIINIVFIGYVCLCVFVSSAVLAIIAAVLKFFLPDYFYMGKKINL